MKARWLVLLAIPVLLCAGSAPGQDTRPKQFTQDAGRYHVKVTFKSVRMTKHEKESYWGGGGWMPPENIVDSFQVMRGKEECFVYRSAYTDLANVTSMSVKATNGGCVITLKGGDAGAAFVATVTIKETDVVERTVRDGEFPDNFYERTVYVNKRVKD